MITKHNFNPIKVVPYVWKDTTLALTAGVAAVVAYESLEIAEVALPFAPIGLLGTALAIFLAFRNNASFGRWAEASAAWQTIVVQSRIFARLTVTFTDGHRATPQYDAERARRFQCEMIERQIAWANVLRLQLRGQDRWSEVEGFLPPDVYEAMLGAENKPLYLLQRQGARLYDAMADGTLQGFDSLQLEGCLASLSAQQGTCERIKSTPIPRQYDYFTRLSVRLFAALLPFCLLSLFAGGRATWLVIPLAGLLAFVFTTVERTGAVNEHPFENRIQDVPMTALCREIERDLRQTLGEQVLPLRLQPQDGYLF